MKIFRFQKTFFISLICFVTLSVLGSAFVAYSEESFESSYYEEFFSFSTIDDESYFVEESFEESLFSDLPTEEIHDELGWLENSEADVQVRSVIAVPQEMISPLEMEAWQGKPEDFHGTKTSRVNKITLSWKHPNGIKKLPNGIKYYIYEIDRNTGVYRQIGKATTSTKKTLSGLIEGEHFFIVRAEKNNQKTGVEIYGEPSEMVSWIVEGSELWKNKPTLSLSQPEDGTILLTFTVKEPADSYEIRQKSGKKWIKIGEITGKESLRYEWSLTGVQTGEKATFCVVPQKDGIQGKASATKSITVRAAWQAAPHLTAAQIGDRKVLLTWKAAARAEEYRIFIDGKRAVDSVITERGENYAILTLKRKAKHKYRVQPWGTTSEGKYISGQKSAAVSLGLVAPSKLGALNTCAHWQSNTLVISWDSENNEAESFDVFLWNGSNEIDETQPFAHIPAGEPFNCTFSELTPEVWYYCVRTNVKTEGKETGRILSEIGSYDVAAAPPAFDDLEVWQLSDTYLASWKAPWPSECFQLRCDGETIAEIKDCVYEFQDLGVGTHTLQVCTVNEEGITNYWSDPLELHICAPLSASVALEESDIVIGEDARFRVQVSGGKGDYHYLYTLTLPDGTSLDTQDKEAVFTYTLEQRGMYSLCVTVSDSLIPEGVQTDPISIQAIDRIEQDGIIYTLSFSGESVKASVSSFLGGNEAHISEQIRDVPVTRIRSEAFTGHAELNILSIPESVTQFDNGWNTGCGEALLIRCSSGSAARSEAISLGLDYDCGGKKRALILAQTYADNPLLKTLKAPANDAAALKSTFESWGFATEIVLNATAGGMLEAIADVLGDAEEDDLSIVTYSGHGLMDGSMPGSDYISASNGVMGAEAFANALSAIQGRKTIIVDACYSGVLIKEDEKTNPEDENTSSLNIRTKSLPMSKNSVLSHNFESSFAQNLFVAFNGYSSYDDGAKQLLRRSGALYGANRTYIMVSAAADQEAWEANIADSGQSRNMGFFAYYLSLGLGWNGVTQQNAIVSADLNADGAVSFSEAFSYASTRTENTLRIYGKSQTAQASPENAIEFAPWRRKGN